MTWMATGKHNSCRRFAKGLLLWTVAHHHRPSTCASFVFRNSIIARYHSSHSPFGIRRRTLQRPWVPSNVPSTTGTRSVQGLASHPSEQFSVGTNQDDDSSGVLSSGSNARSNNNDNLSPLALAIQNSIDSVFRLQVNNDYDDDGPLVPGDDKKKKKVLVVTISVSGGCDSVALLHACMECSWSLGLESTMPTLVQVVHFNHQQRGMESDEDATFVQDLCRTYRIPCHVELWNKELENLEENSNGVDDDTETLSSSKAPTFSQDAAREWRRQCLVAWTQHAMDNLSSSGDYGGEGSIGVILTAHHKDDSMESLVLKALRGVHLLNLSGMTCLTPLTSSSSSSRSPIYLIRPWIQDVPKHDLIQYLQQNNWSWREDQSNQSSKYLRNRVRNELIPLLQDMTDQSFVSTRIPTWIQQSQELVQDLQPRVQALSKQVVSMVPGRDGTRGDFPYLEWDKSCQLVDSTHDLAITPLVQSQTLYQWMTHYAACPISHDTFQRVLNQLRNHPQKREWRVELGQGWKIQRQGGILRIKKPKTTPTTMSDNSSGKNRKEAIPWSWSILSPEELDRIRQESCKTLKNHQISPMRFSNREEIILWIPKDWIIQPTVIFYETTVAEYEQEYQTSVVSQSNQTKTSLMFCPPWKSASSTPIKLRQFLRGQGIPLHQRDHVPLLIANHCIVAVQIQRGDSPCPIEWIVNRDYYYHPSADIPSSTPSDKQPDCNPNDAKTKVPIRLSTLNGQRRN